MPKNGLTALREMISNDFATYDVKEIKSGLPAYSHLVGFEPIVTYQIYTDELHIDFQYCQFFHHNHITFAVIKNNGDEPRVVKTIDYKNYTEAKAKLSEIKSIIHELTYYGLNTRSVFVEFMKYCGWQQFSIDFWIKEGYI